MANPRAQSPRPGGGTSAAAPRQRILRIGVLLGGKIVEERLIRERVPVTIGQSMKNTFSIPIDGLPLEFTLFAIDDGRYSLRFLSKMEGRLSDSGGQVDTLEALKAKGASKAGEYYQVALSDSARGKLSLGDLTILFQFVTEPPRQPKPMLPASVRGTFADRFDPRLMVIVGSSIILHFMVVIIAWMGDIEKDGLAEKAYDLTFEPEKYQVELKPEPEPVTDAGSAAGSDGEKKPDVKPNPQPKPAGNDGGRNEKDNVAMDESDAAAFADKLTVEGKDGKDPGDMSSRNPNTDLNKQIDNVREGNKTVSNGGGTGRGSRGNGDPKTGTGTGPKIDGPGGIDSAGGGKVAEKGPAGRISVSTKTALDESSLTADLVLAKIQSVYMAGLKRCYKNYLNKDASARGKVVLSFTVNESGSTVGGKANGFADEVDTCIGAQMGGWRFPVPKDKDGEKTSAGFQIALQLVPD
ncbi:MAG: AgmX/PglI C-terminal domain-containing protein [Deltaproteobacteria bacterium]|nr:AgmX/PglI C-terminal domain-containing protein [Deltaproteobacteria bacterium]